MLLTKKASSFHLMPFDFVDGTEQISNFVKDLKLIDDLAINVDIVYKYRHLKLQPGQLAWKLVIKS